MRKREICCVQPHRTQKDFNRNDEPLNRCNAITILHKNATDYMLFELETHHVKKRNVTILESVCVWMRYVAAILFAQNKNTVIEKDDSS